MSKETKWTPGPWVSGGCSGRMIQPKSNQGFDHWVADVDTTANVNLIAAAPELYEALMQAKKELEDIAMAEIGEPYNNLQINAALAKARGEQ